MGGNSWVKRGIASVVLAAVVLVGTAGTALAHECYNDSRSARGDAKAAEGAGWTSLSEVFLRFVVPSELGFAPLDETQVQEALALIATEKASGDFAEIYALDRSVLNATTAMQGKGVVGTAKESDDRAIDHASANLDELGPLVDHLIGIYFQVGGTGPGA